MIDGLRDQSFAVILSRYVPDQLQLVFRHCRIADAPGLNIAAGDLRPALHREPGNGEPYAPRRSRDQDNFFSK